MTNRTATRARKPRPRAGAPDQPEMTPEELQEQQELNEAAQQEQAEANEAQRIHLGQRVARLRARNNKLEKRVAELEEELGKFRKPQDRQPPAKKTTARKTTPRKTAGAAS